MEGRNFLTNRFRLPDSRERKGRVGDERKGKERKGEEGIGRDNGKISIQ